MVKDFYNYHIQDITAVGTIFNVSSMPLLTILPYGSNISELSKKMSRVTS